MLFIDYALGPLLSAPGAQHTLQGVFVVESQIKHDVTTIQLDPAAEERLADALRHLADEMLHRLSPIAWRPARKCTIAVANGH